jgi:molybdopterin-dependent oxidoreductase alpha subunit
MKRVKSGGGWPAIWYTLRKGREAGGVVRMVRALGSRNACKTCALGMGGQRGGMRNEAGRFPEVCKKSVQAMAADMQGRIPNGFFEAFGFDRLGRMSPRELEASGRIVTPLYAGADDAGYRAIGWDEAIDRTAEAMKASPPDESFFYFSGRSSNEAGFLLQLFARLYGTNNVNNCSYFCHQASGVGLSGVTGSGTATVELEDLDRCDTVFVIGGNPASNHPRLMRSLMDLRRRGGTVVVINPLREIGLVKFRVPSDVRSLLFGSKIATDYVQPHIGGDIALLTGIAKSLCENGAIDTSFIEQHTEGFEAWASLIRQTAWDTIVRTSGVDLETIENVARRYAESKRAIFCWTMGITHHAHGVDNVRAIANLALMRGMVGKPGCGLLPLRGHSNVQGIGSIGAVPNLKPHMLRALEERYGVRLPETKGLDTLACIERAGAGRMRFAWHLGGNLYGSCPDSANASRSLRAIGTTVFLSTTLNTGHVHGRGAESIILPVLARDEEQQKTTQESMFNFVRLSDGGPTRHAGLRSEVQVIAAVAKRVLGENSVLDFDAMEHHSDIRKAIAAVTPGYEEVATIDGAGSEFQIPGRTFHEARFATESGRARFHTATIPDAPPLAENEVRLMSVRSEGQFNTVVYEEYDLYRGQERRDVLLMSESDMQRLGLSENDTVSVVSETGRMDGIHVRLIDIRPGNAAMYYPECNVLFSSLVDGESRTPAFKNIAVRIERSVALPTG